MSRHFLCALFQFLHDPVKLSFSCNLSVAICSSTVGNIHTATAWDVALLLTAQLTGTSLLNSRCTPIWLSLGTVTVTATRETH